MGAKVMVEVGGASGNKTYVGILGDVCGATWLKAAVPCLLPALARCNEVIGYRFGCEQASNYHPA